MDSSNATNETKKRAQIYAKVFMVCCLISFGLSVGFWLFFGIFQLSGFILWSLLSALMGTVKFVSLRRIFRDKTFVNDLAWAGGISSCIVLRIGIFLLSRYV
ncbi:hypothetical protein P0082_06775 [Candidatus Haliotispira prima]|uniref:Uncharacterized protein n=1 Tax=Candidatus Haliotispira prima TaxID=3034016 RepID=A0ABY8MH55_9SPIO|nr:hypothetical protein P0082_06775 [Candidatus Haliotispira prima]